jgi:hypothetical protein
MILLPGWGSDKERTGRLTIDNAIFREHYCNCIIVAMARRITRFMTREAKLMKRLLDEPRDFTYAELKSVMTSFGFEEDSSGKSSGSRVAFFHPNKKLVLRLHKPHPGNELKNYQIKQVIGFLKETGDIV